MYNIHRYAMRFEKKWVAFSVFLRHETIFSMNTNSQLPHFFSEVTRKSNVTPNNRDFYK